MDNKFIPKKVWITRPPNLKNRRDPLIWMKKIFG